MKINDAAELIKSQILSKIATRGRVIVAIDGRCGSGKSTLAATLAEMLNSPVVHADDFFLPPNRRTAERLAEPGGNLDRERLLDEVIVDLRAGRDATYRPYICRDATLGAPISVRSSLIVIIEGSYSHHPDLAPYYDLRVFLDVSPEAQLARLTLREPLERLDAFLSRWIPLEEKYISALSVKDKADTVIILD